MKISPPDLSDDLLPSTELANLLRKDETLTGLFIHDSSAPSLRVKSAAINDTKLLKCELPEARFEKLQLQDCVIESCNLMAGSFADSSWHAVEIVDTRCSGIQLQTSLLKNVLFKSCKLDFANIRFARLENVIFQNCVITELDLYSAQLKRVAFVGCDIERVEFSEAKLQHVDLSESTIISLRGVTGLKGAVISPEQLIQVAPYLAREIGLMVKN